MLLLLGLRSATSRSEMSSYTIVQHFKALSWIISGYLLVICVPVVIHPSKRILKLFEAVLLTSTSCSSTTFRCAFLPCRPSLICASIWRLNRNLLRLIMMNVRLVATSRCCHLSWSLIISATKRTAFTVFIRSRLSLCSCPRVRAIRDIRVLSRTHFMCSESPIEFLGSFLLTSRLVQDLFLGFLLVPVHQHGLLLIEAGRFGKFGEIHQLLLQSSFCCCFAWWEGCGYSLWLFLCIFR